jgi:predicted GIY-YIG superfamily endonuclease
MSLQDGGVLVPPSHRPITSNKEEKKMSKKKLVYVAKREDEKVKIGITSDIERRKKELENQSGFKIYEIYLSEVCSNASQIESSLHRLLKTKRVKGEWFENCFAFAVEFIKNTEKETNFKQDNCNVDEQWDIFLGMMSPDFREFMIRDKDISNPFLYSHERAQLAKVQVEVFPVPIPGDSRRALRASTSAS